MARGIEIDSTADTLKRLDSETMSTPAVVGVHGYLPPFQERLCTAHELHQTSRMYNK